MSRTDAKDSEERRGERVQEEKKKFGSVRCRGTGYMQPDFETEFVQKAMRRGILSTETLNGLQPVTRPERMLMSPEDMTNSYGDQEKLVGVGRTGKRRSDKCDLSMRAMLTACKV